MKKIACLLCLLSLAFIMFLAVGCESLTGPEGKYACVQNRIETYAVVFEKKKVTIYQKYEKLGTFDYEYKRDETDKNKGTLTIKSDDYPWVMDYDYSEKKLSCDINNEGIRYNFFKK